MIAATAARARPALISSAAPSPNPGNPDSGPDADWRGCSRISTPLFSSRAPISRPPLRLAVRSRGVATCAFASGLPEPPPCVPLDGRQASGSDERPQGNESRLTRYRAQYLHEISRVHGGALATPFDGTLIGDFAHEIEGEMANHGHVLGSVAYTQA